MGQNPEILSVLRLLVKAFQYDLTINPASLKDIEDIVKNFEPNTVTDYTALRRINEAAVKLVMHSNNIENALDTLDSYGLTAKLLKLDQRGQGADLVRYWLQKEPLRSYDIPGSDLTAFATGTLGKPEINQLVEAPSAPAKTVAAPPAPKSAPRQKGFFSAILDLFNPTGSDDVEPTQRPSKASTPLAPPQPKKPTGLPD